MRHFVVLAFLGLSFCSLHAEPPNSVSQVELESAIEDSLPKVPEFKFIREQADALGVKVYLFGGTAAGFAHYTHWDLRRKKGDTRFQKERFDYDYTNIYRSNQDLDIVIDGPVIKASELQRRLHERYPHFQGNKSAWEVRTLRERVGEKEALLNNPDFLNQHSDSNSTGLIELTTPEPGKTRMRDVKSWESPSPPFVNDILDGALHYYFSESHGTTSRAQAGLNPPILSVIRFLTKAFQFELKIREEDWARIKAIIDSFDARRDLNNEYLRTWIEKNAKKLVQNAVNVDYAIKKLDELGLRKKLVNWGKPELQDTMSWWLNKRPLSATSFGSLGTRAKELNITEVAHETNSFMAYESITRSHEGTPNVFISRAGVRGEAAAFGDGFYTRIGKQGARNTGFTIRFRVNPEARLGTDFIMKDDFVIVRNKAMLEVTPESLDITPLGFFSLLRTMGPDDRGTVEKLKRRIGPRLRDVGIDERQKIIDEFILASKEKQHPYIEVMVDSFIACDPKISELRRVLEYASKEVYEKIQTQWMARSHPAEELLELIWPEEEETFDFYQMKKAIAAKNVRRFAELRMNSVLEKRLLDVFPSIRDDYRGYRRLLDVSGLPRAQDFMKKYVEIDKSRDPAQLNLFSWMVANTFNDFLKTKPTIPQLQYCFRRVEPIVLRKIIHVALNEEQTANGIIELLRFTRPDGATIAGHDWSSITEVFLTRKPTKGELIAFQALIRDDHSAQGEILERLIHSAQSIQELIGYLNFMPADGKNMHDSLYKGVQNNRLLPAALKRMQELNATVDDALAVRNSIRLDDVRIHFMESISPFIKSGNDLLRLWTFRRSNTSALYVEAFKKRVPEMLAKGLSIENKISVAKLEPSHGRTVLDSITDASDFVLFHKANVHDFKDTSDIEEFLERDPNREQRLEFLKSEKNRGRDSDHVRHELIKMATSIDEMVELLRTFSPDSESIIKKYGRLVSTVMTRALSFKPNVHEMVRVMKALVGDADTVSKSDSTPFLSSAQNLRGIYSKLKMFSQREFDDALGSIRNAFLDSVFTVNDFNSLVKACPNQELAELFVTHAGRVLKTPADYLELLELIKASERLKSLAFKTWGESFAYAGPSSEQVDQFLKLAETPGGRSYLSAEIRSSLTTDKPTLEDRISHANSRHFWHEVNLKMRLIGLVKEPEHIRDILRVHIPAEARSERAYAMLAELTDKAYTKFSKFGTTWDDEVDLLERARHLPNEEDLYRKVFATMDSASDFAEYLDRLVSPLKELSMEKFTRVINSAIAEFKRHSPKKEHWKQVLESDVAKLSGPVRQTFISSMTPDMKKKLGIMPCEKALDFVSHASAN